MSNEKTISNIKKAIKEHLDNNYKYDMLVDFELDVIDWNSLLEYINELQQENKQLKELIDKAINELSILKNMIYKPETREENFEIQKKISSLIKRLNSKEVSDEKEN